MADEDTAFSLSSMQLTNPGGVCARRPAGCIPGKCVISQLPYGEAMAGCIHRARCEILVKGLERVWGSGFKVRDSGSGLKGSGWVCREHAFKSAHRVQ